MSVWPKAPIGDLAHWRGGLTPSMGNPNFWTNGDIPWISSKEVVGGVLKDTERKVTRQAIEETSLRLVPAGSVAVVVRSGILLHTFPVALVPFQATVNQDVKIGTPIDGVLPEYLAFCLQANGEQILQRFRKTGTTVQSVDVPGLLGFEVPLPPAPEQRRIVDLIGSVQAEAAAIDVEAETVEEVLRCLLDQAWASMDDVVPVGFVADLASGPSWAAADERLAAEQGTTGVIKITNTRPDGRLDLSERLYVKGLPSSTRLLDDRSLIAIRTNGNRERIGNVYLPNDEVFGSAVSAFQFIVQCQSSDHRDYLFWAMRAPQCQRLMSDAASGSTGLGNMGARWLRALEIPWPDAEARTRFVEQATVTACLHEGLLDQGASLRAVGSTLLTSLLSGQMTIPESYDALLAEAV